MKHFIIGAALGFFAALFPFKIAATFFLGILFALITINLFKK